MSTTSGDERMVVRQLPRKGAHVVLDAVSKRYRLGEQVITALEDVALSVAAGSIVAITGPSGSGKSTLLHVVGAMDAPDSGRIEVDDVVVTSLDRKRQVDYRRRIGFVFQRFHLLPTLTALDNVAAPLLPYRTGFDKFDRARRTLAAVGLGGREESLPSRLSGGQQQRVAIARALVNDPMLLHPKSALAREWIIQRLERESIDRKIAEAAKLHAGKREEVVKQAWNDATDAWLRALDAEDGGYDWGPDGPPV